MSNEQIEQMTKKHPINVLVHGLDNDDAIKMLAEEQFTLAGINFRWFTDREDFIKNLRLKPHICFIDYMLPGELDGVKVTKIVTDDNPECKVIMFSGYRDWDAMHEFFNKAGGWRWLEKKGFPQIKTDLLYIAQEAIVYVKERLKLQFEIDKLKEESQQRKKVKERRSNGNI